MRSWPDCSPQSLKLKFSLMIGISSRWPGRAAPDAYDRLVRRYASFVRLKASSYFLVGGDSEDLIQEGLVGLYKAIRDFRPDRESSFRNFAELCITRQIITAVKTATRNKHTPLNGYVSFSRDAGRRVATPSRRLDEMLPGSTVHDPVNQVISSEELRSLVACLSTVLSELESRVLSLYLDGYSYTDDRRAARLRLQDRRQRAAARQAQGRRAPRLARRPELDRSYCCSCHLAHHRPRRPRRPRRRRRHRPQPRSSRAHAPRSSARSRRSTTTSPPPRPRTAAGTRDASRPPRAASTPSSAAPSPTS